jgi:hypothetical protein
MNNKNNTRNLMNYIQEYYWVVNELALIKVTTH